MRLPRIHWEKILDDWHKERFCSVTVLQYEYEWRYDILYNVWGKNETCS